MKKDSKIIGKDIDAILNSIDVIKRAEAPEYFYTRLTSRMEASQHAAKGGLLQVFNRPLVGISILVLFLILNLVAIKGIISSPKGTQGSLSDVQSFAREYNLNTTTVYTN